MLSVVIATRRISGLLPEQDLDGAAVVHRPVALGGAVEREGEVEDLSRVDLATPDEVDQLGQEATHRRGSAVQVDAGEEQFADRTVPDGRDRLARAGFGCDGGEPAVRSWPTTENA